MSPTTWPPSADSHFKFLIDGELRATVGNNEIAFVTGLPTDRPVRIKVILDEKPFESFRLSLGKEPDHRVCLRLYTDYWHWINTGWMVAYGCTCKTDGGQEQPQQRTPKSPAGAQAAPSVLDCPRPCGSGLLSRHLLETLGTRAPTYAPKEVCAQRTRAMAVLMRMFVSAEGPGVCP